MTEENKGLLKEHLIRMASIAKYARECSLYSHELHFPYDYSEKHLFVSSPDIDFLRFVLRNTVILELSKLFLEKGNHKYSIRKLINELKNTFGEKNLSSYAENLYNEFKEKKSSLINDIHKIRDKIIAHSDLEEVDAENSIFEHLQNFNDFISFSYDLTREIYKRVFEEDMPFDFESPFFGKTRFELLTVFKEYKSVNP
jgi:hypothetical protein